MEQMFFNYNPHLKHLVNHTERHAEALHKEQKKSSQVAKFSNPSKEMEAPPHSTLPQKYAPEGIEPDILKKKKEELENKVMYFLEKKKKEEVDIIESRKKRFKNKKRNKKYRKKEEKKFVPPVQGNAPPQYTESLILWDENFIIADEKINPGILKSA